MASSPALAWSLLLRAGLALRTIPLGTGCAVWTGIAGRKLLTPDP